MNLGIVLGRAAAACRQQPAALCFRSSTTSGALATYNQREDARRMCRNIRPLFNFDPPATDEEIRAASLQFVRKLSGFTRPSKANGHVFDEAVDEIAATARRLLDRLETSAPARDRAEWAERARARSAARFGGAERQ
jgi:hypothetical protein